MPSEVQSRGQPQTEQDMAGIVRSDSAPGAVQCQCGKLHHHHHNTGGSSGAADSLRNVTMFGNKSVLTFGVLTDLPSSVNLSFPCVRDTHPLSNQKKHLSSVYSVREVIYK